MNPGEEPKAASEPSQSRPPLRRSRRGGRRYSRGRGPRSAVRPAAEPGEPVEPAVAPDISHDVQPAQAVEKEPAPKAAAVSDAIEQVNRVIEELKHALNDMEEVLETLEFAERQKIDDEREIESLQRALRQLHRPSAGALSRR